MNASMKLQQLIDAVGFEYSDNFSKTCRAELLHVLTKGDVDSIFGGVKCIVRDVDAHGRVGGAVRIEDGTSTWNAMFY